MAFSTRFSATAATRPVPVTTALAERRGSGQHRYRCHGVSVSRYTKIVTISTGACAQCKFCSIRDSDKRSSTRRAILCACSRMIEGTLPSLPRPPAPPLERLDNPSKDATASAIRGCIGDKVDAHAFDRRASLKSRNVKIIVGSNCGPPSRGIQFEKSFDSTRSSHVTRSGAPEARTRLTASRMSAPKTACQQIVRPQAGNKFAPPR